MLLQPQRRGVRNERAWSGGGGRKCQISFPEAGAGVGDKRDPLVVKVALHPGYRDRLQIGCNRSGDAALLHQGASLAMLLEEKTSLGLAECVETTQDGKMRLAVTLPGMQSLDAPAAALAKLMAARESGTAGEAGAA